MTFRILTAEEVAEYEREAKRARRTTNTAHCLCGRFAKFVKREEYTLPYGETVVTVQCSRCGEVRIR